MSKKTRKLQKFSLIMGQLSFLFAIICAIFVFIKARTLGMDHEITTSLMAAIVFFLFVGVVLFIMGKADIPDLSVRPKSDIE